MNRKTALFLILGCAGICQEPQAAVWTVTNEPGHAVGAIGAVVAACASGDTIRIGPGRYFEHIALEEKSLRLESTEGAATTILDGSATYPPGFGAILTGSRGFTGYLIVEGLGFEHGAGSTNQWGSREGGAIRWPGGRFEARNCVFRENMGGTYGGAIYLKYATVADLDGCSFEANEAEIGGHIAMFNSGALTIRSCHFTLSRGGGQGNIVAGGVTPITIEDSAFESWEPLPLPDACSIRVQVTEMSVVRCRFEDFGEPLATSVGLDPGSPFPDEPWPGKTVFSENVIINHGPAPQENDVGGVAIGQYGEEYIQHNTFVRIRFRCGLSGNGPLVVSDNIFYESPSGVTGPGGTSIRCNDFWPDSVVTYGWGPYEMENNISVDPGFCDLENGDIRIERLSPCAEGQSPGCLQIGALGVGCDGMPVVPMSWGRLKAIWKGGGMVR